MKRLFYTARFRSLSYLMYGTQKRAMEVQIVDYVVANWQDFAFKYHDMNRDNYSSEAEYYTDMLKHSTRSLCEKAAAGQLYSFVFEVFRNGDLM